MVSLLVDQSEQFLFPSSAPGGNGIVSGLLWISTNLLASKVEATYLI